MILNVVLGFAVVGSTVLLHAIGLIVLSSGIVTLVSMFDLGRHDLAKTLSMLPMVLGLFVLHGAEILIWAVAFIWTGALPDWETALYFSTATFSTLGFGDVVLAKNWRLFGSFEGVNGFLLIGWSTAYLISASMRHGPFRAGEHF
jgi:hypothetical protein